MVLAYGSSSSVVFDSAMLLNQNSATIISTIDSISKAELGAANATIALNYTVSHLFANGNLNVSSIPGAHPTLIMINGASVTVGSGAVSILARLKSSQASLYSVTVGSASQSTDLSVLASNPVATHSYSVSSFYGLQQLSTIVQAQLVKGMEWCIQLYKHSL